MMENLTLTSLMVELKEAIMPQQKPAGATSEPIGSDYR